MVSYEQIGGETSEMLGNLLDKLSPNWDKADSCAKVELREVEVKENSGGAQ